MGFVCPTNHKVNLIKSLTSRALRICSPETIAEEMAKLRTVFLDYGYPVHLVDRLIKNTAERKRIETSDGEAGYMCILLPWIGNRNTEFGRSIKQAAQKAFTRTVPRVIFTTTRAFSGRAKDVLPTMAKSCIIYEFECCCEQAYIDKTIQRLCERVNQHIPAKLLQSTAKARLRKVPADSATTKHRKKTILRAFLKGFCNNSRLWCTPDTSRTSMCSTRYA